MLLNIPEFFRLAGFLSGQPTNFKDKVISGSKIHALKNDQSDFYKPGTSIVICYNKRKSSSEIIHEAKVVSTQSVEIKYSILAGATPDIIIDGRRLGLIEIIALAANEGFDQLDHFLMVHNVSEIYKLIHWTDYRYDGNMQRLQAVNDRQQTLNKM